MTVIKLQYPIKCEGREITELEIRRSKTKDVLFSKKSTKSDGDAMVHLIATLSGLPPSAIEETDSSDFKRANDLVESFLV